MTPARTLDQRLAALQKANEIRVRRAQFKRELQAHPERVVDVLQRPPSWAETMYVKTLLEAIPGLGHVKVRSLLNGCRISSHKTLVGLSSRQRDEVVSAVTGRWRTR